VARESLELRRQTRSSRLDEASSLTVLGRILAERKAYAEAEALFTQAIAIRRERLGEDHPSVARTRGYLAALPQRGPNAK
jgi:hypothetical protein